jgi:hypothetical protein
MVGAFVVMMIGKKNKADIQSFFDWYLEGPKPSGSREGR